MQQEIRQPGENLHFIKSVYRAKPFLSEWVGVGPHDLARSNLFDTRNGNDNTTLQQSWAILTIIKYATERWY